jgi:hypothetical protein
MRHHHRRMDTGIGTSGSRYGNIFAQQHLQCLLQRFLHALAIWLDLPTMIGSAVVTKFNEISHYFTKRL